MRSSEVSLQAMCNGASTASVSGMSSSIFSTSLSPYRTLTTSIIPVIYPQSQSPQLSHPPVTDRTELFFKLRDLGRCVTFIGSFLAFFFFRVNLWFFLLCCYITVPSLTDRYYRHTLAASLNYSTQAHTQKLTGLVSTPTPLKWENARPKMRLQLQKCFNFVVLPHFKEFLANTWIMLTPLTAELKGFDFYRLKCIFKTDKFIPHIFQNLAAVCSFQRKTAAKF